MNICLINPPWLTKKGSIWHRIRCSMPPLGLLYLASYLEKNGIRADVLDFQADFKSWEEIKEKISSATYDYYGITGTTPIIKNAFRLSRIIKDIHPEAKVILGGIHVTALPEEALWQESIDFVIRGEGEDALLKLIKKDPFCSIQGLSYKEGKDFRHILPDGIIHDLDKLPFPAFHKVNLKLYKPSFGAYKRLPAINMMTARGCPGRCTFCNSANIALRKRSVKNIFDEIKMLYQDYGMREIQFYDDTFTVYHNTVEELCDLLIESGIKVSWCCFARTDTVTQGLLNKMKKAGCHQLMYGIESADEGILKAIRKNINFEKNKIAVELAKKARIAVRCTFMFGNPGETEETIERTIKYSMELDPDISLYNITTPYPGTPMFEWAEQNGYLITKNWDDYDLSGPVMKLPTISNGLLEKKYRQAFGAFYLRPRFIIKNIFRKASFQDIFFLIEGLKKISGFLGTP